MLDRGRPLDLALAENRSFGGLDDRDRGFARHLATTVLRRRGEIDRLIADRLERPLANKHAMVGAILRMGVAQLRFLDVPDYAAIDTSVSLARRRTPARMASLINAVLRRLTRERPPALEPAAAARINTPDWLWRSWVDAYGEPTAAAVAAAHLSEPPLDLSVRNDAAEWAARLGGDALPTGGVRISRAGPVDLLSGYAEGAWWVQDAAASLPARVLGDVAGKTVIDLCAAPGGKTAQLAAAGARVIAVDVDRRRMDRLRENMDRLGLTGRVETVVADATAWQPDRPADAVLLDAPCTATGTIRRHPDIAWLKRADDVTAMAAIQDRLLDAAFAMVRPGGPVVFCTCSLQAEEGPARIAAALERERSTKLDPIAGAGGLIPESFVADGALRTLPCHWAERGGIDGFFAARLHRPA